VSASDAAVEAAVDEISALLDQRIGLRPEPTLRGRLSRSLRDEVSAHGDDLDAYIESLSRSSDMLQSLVNRVTVQESGFFRHPDHFVILAEQVLPSLTGPVTIWSAGCANGQEAYSLAMVLEEQGVRGSVVATDLSTRALARTQSALYATREITGISAERRARHLTAEGPDWRMNPSVRARVSVARHNLARDLPAHVGHCQVVMCRNVLIYFSPEHARAFLDKLAAAMPPGGYLFLGSAETLWQVTDRFKAVRLGSSFVHRREEDIAAQKPKVSRSRTALDASKSRQSVARTPPLAPVRTAAVASAVEPGRVRSKAWLKARANHVDASDVFQPVVLASAGQQALSLGDTAGAVVAFRKWVYLTPDDPLASFHLGLALEAGGHTRSAQRSFGVALDILRDGGTTLGAEIALEGYAPKELLRMLEKKQGRHA
jgi:chemotaxis methyl-accepting protein methylase